MTRSVSRMSSWFATVFPAPATRIGLGNRDGCDFPRAGAVRRLTEALPWGSPRWPTGGDAATTAVAAVVRGRKAEIAWMGDSRAYWIGERISKQLTRDDSG